MKNKAKILPYHYKDSGLDYIYLANGYEVIHDPEFGKAVSIHDLGGLNKAITLMIINHAPFIRGQELRFLRSQLKLNQTEMGLLLGCDLRTIQRWEEKRNEAISSRPADNFLRLFCSDYIDGQRKAHSLCDYIKDSEDRINAVKTRKGTEALFPRIELADTGEGWKKAA